MIIWKDGRFTRRPRVNCEPSRSAEAFSVVAATGECGRSIRVWGAHTASVLVRETRERNCGYLSILWNRRVMLLTDMPAVRFGDDPRTLI